MLYKKIIPFSQIERIECIKANGKVESIASVYKRSGADIVFNAPIYEFDTGEILTRFVCNGVIYGKKQPPVFGFSFNPYPVWNWDNGLKAKNYCAPYTYAVIDGIAKDGLNDKAKRARTAIGVTENNEMAIYVVSDNDTMKCTTKVLCERLVSMGCKYAINLDGGGSSQIYSNEVKYSSGRNVAGYIGIWLKKTAPAPLNNCYEVTATSLNVRATPNPLSKKVGSYHKGDVINVLEISDKWARTNLGWCSIAYLKKSAGYENKYLIMASLLNIRSSPSANSSIVGALKKGEIVDGDEYNTQWIKIGEGKYISSLYVKKV